jgi:hypothetical protein
LHGWCASATGMLCRSSMWLVVLESTGEPWLTPEAVRPGHVSVHTAESDSLTVCGMSHMEVDGRVSRVHFEYLIGRPEGIRHVSEVHELGLFTIAELLDCFRSAGFSVDHDPAGLMGRGLYVARLAAS